jgi:hypothetical protein
MTATTRCDNSTTAAGMDMRPTRCELAPSGPSWVPACSACAVPGCQADALGAGAAEVVPWHSSRMINIRLISANPGDAVPSPKRILMTYTKPEGGANASHP